MAVEDLALVPNPNTTKKKRKNVTFLERRGEINNGKKKNARLKGTFVDVTQTQFALH